MSSPRIFECLDGSNHVLFSNICQHLDIYDVVALTRTCGAFAHLYKTLQRSRWNINKHLLKFVKDPLRFRTLQGLCQALVSGSDCLQFLESARYENSDLDLYVGKRYPDVQLLGSYLMHEEGYKYTPSSWQPPNFADALEKISNLGRCGFFHTMDGDPASNIDRFHDELYSSKSIAGVLTLKKDIVDEESGDNRCLTVQIIVTKDMPLHTIISDFYSTHVMNFYSVSQAYSLFPSLTFGQKVGVLTFPTPNEKVQKCIQKYAKRGWNFQSCLWEEQLLKSCAGAIDRTRKIKDSKTWIMNLDTSEILGQLQHMKIDSWNASIENSTFNFKATKKGYESDFAIDPNSTRYECKMLETKEFRSEVLRWDYLVADQSWIKFLGERVYEAKEMEAVKWSDRPYQWGHNWYGSSAFYREKPEGYNYADEKIPIWWAHYQERLKQSKTT